MESKPEKKMLSFLSFNNNGMGWYQSDQPCWFAQTILAFAPRVSCPRKPITPRQRQPVVTVDYPRGVRVLLGGKEVK
jgi:hypothetical protein